MLETVKQHIREVPDTPFAVYYQNYICEVQDQNIVSEISSVKTADITSLNKLIARLNMELDKR